MNTSNPDISLVCELLSCSIKAYLWFKLRLNKTKVIIFAVLAVLFFCTSFLFSKDIDETLLEGFTEVYPGIMPNVGYGSTAWFDYDNDGFLDILITGATVPNSNISTSRIYRNTGNGFIEVYAGSLTGVGASSVACGDYDNDGLIDIILTGSSVSGPVSKLYRNTGSSYIEVFMGSFTGVSDGSVSWTDFNNDGFQDILITGSAQEGYVSKLYRNNVNGFSEVYNGALIGVGFSSVAWADYDNDGYSDILLTGLANDGQRKSKIYKNTGNGFTEVYPGSLVPVRVSSVAWGDYDADGKIDILLTGETTDGSPASKIYRNTGSGFTEVYQGNLIAVHNSSSSWGDYDNDGDLDIILVGVDGSNLRSMIYRNNGNGFTEVLTGLFPSLYVPTVSWGDYDNDGDLDILLTGRNNSTAFKTHLFRNEGNIFNAIPTSPSSLSATVSQSSVTLSWNKSIDVQTPQNGLTYNIRVGTTANGINFSSPLSNINTGFRRVARIGSTNHNNSWTLKNLPNGTYYWSVQAIDNNFAGSQFAPVDTFTINTTSIISNNQLPIEFALSQNFPNPFNPITKISYNLPFNSKVSIKISDIQGKELFQLVNETKSAGYYSVQLNGANMASGIYFYNIVAEGVNTKFTSTKKMVLIK